MSLRKLSETAFTKLANGGDGCSAINVGRSSIILRIASDPDGSAVRDTIVPPQGHFSIMSGGDGHGVFAKGTAPGGEVFAEIAQARFRVPV